MDNLQKKCVIFTKKNDTTNLIKVLIKARTFDAMKIKTLKTTIKFLQEEADEVFRLATVHYENSINTERQNANSERNEARSQKRQRIETQNELDTTNRNFRDETARLYTVIQSLVDKTTAHASSHKILLKNKTDRKQAYNNLSNRYNNQRRIMVGANATIVALQKRLIKVKNSKISNVKIITGLRKKNKILKEINEVLKEKNELLKEKDEALEITLHVQSRDKLQLTQKIGKFEKIIKDSRIRAENERISLKNTINEFIEQYNKFITPTKRSKEELKKKTPDHWDAMGVRMDITFLKNTITNFIKKYKELNTPTKRYWASDDTQEGFSKTVPHFEEGV